MLDVLREAAELLEDERLDARQFRAFAFENAARFYTDSNPGFFDGTIVQDAVAEFRSQELDVVG